jgi:hypothetical protein
MVARKIGVNAARSQGTILSWFGHVTSLDSRLILKSVICTLPEFLPIDNARPFGIMRLGIFVISLAAADLPPFSF